MLLPRCTSSDPSGAQKPPCDFGNRPAIKNAVEKKRFTIVFNRPKTAIEIPVQVRVEQLRKIFSNATRIVAQFIQVEVTPDENRSVFTIIFTYDPHHPITEKSVGEATKLISNPEKIHKIVTDGTGLDPKNAL